MDEAGALLRRIHDATVGFEQPDVIWQFPSHDPVEVICLNDVAPYNMVFVDGRLTGLIDVDTASPGPRIWDLAYLAYRLVPFVEDAGAPFTPQEQRERLQRLDSAYGAEWSTEEILSVMIDRLLELADFTDGRAAQTGRVEFVDTPRSTGPDAARISRRGRLRACGGRARPRRGAARCRWSRTGR